MNELKYNWEVIGHQKRLMELEKELADDNVAHAYLFAGPSQLGKFSIAKKMANILQCENNYCHTCAVCQEIAKGYHGDTIELVDDGESIKIEALREILSRLHMSRQGRHKILLIQNIERMTPESANAILKTLEDPPEKVIFLLTTGNVQDVLPTILSRVRTHNFHRVAEQDVFALLQNLYPLADGDELKTMSTFSMGRPGMAVSFMENAEVYAAYKKMYNDIIALVKKPDRVDQFVYVAELVKDSQEAEGNHMLQEFLEALQEVLRKEMIEKTGDEAAVKKVLLLLREAQKAHDLLKRNVNKKLLLENLMLQL